MRLPVAVMFLAVALPALCKIGDSSHSSQNSAEAIAIFDPDPAHLWNRLYAALLVREDHAAQFGADSLDPPLWAETEYLLAKPSHERALHVLDEFLHARAENLIQDPVKRAILQRDLWAVFDWTVEQSPAYHRPRYVNEKRELQARLAALLHRLAMTRKEIDDLPDNYTQAVNSGAFAREYDSAHRDRPFLPPDLFDPHGPWVLVEAGPNAFDTSGVATNHVIAFSGRSSFLVFVRLPEGRKSTLGYLQSVWDFPQPWVPGSNPSSDEVILNPDLPSFPAKTEVALLRMMTLFDNDGNLQSSAIVESVQIRVYERVTANPERFEEGDNGQAFFQIRLSRPLLFANKAGGLRSTGRDEKELFTFGAQGDDLIDEISKKPALTKTWPTVLESCQSCHSGGGIRSLNSREKLLKPNRRQPNDTDGPYPARWWVNSGTPNWKQDRYDWGLLNGYWNATGSH
jgi:hypothetical protein